MRRRYLALLLGLCALLTACSGGAHVDASSQENAPEPTILLGFSQLGWESAWRLANSESIKAAAEQVRTFLSVVLSMVALVWYTLDLMKKLGENGVNNVDSTK